MELGCGLTASVGVYPEDPSACLYCEGAQILDGLYVVCHMWVKIVELLVWIQQSRILVMCDV
jgi:hypothetical protein